MGFAPRRREGGRLSSTYHTGEFSAVKKLRVTADRLPDPLSLCFPPPSGRKFLSGEKKKTCMPKMTEERERKQPLEATKPFEAELSQASWERVLQNKRENPTLLCGIYFAGPAAVEILASLQLRWIPEKGTKERSKDGMTGKLRPLTHACVPL